MEALKKKIDYDVQIVEFIINTNEAHYFGISIDKVKEIIKVPKITKVPDTHPAIMGTILLRGSVISVIHLPFYLKYKDNKSFDDKKAKIIITYINKQLNGFLVDDITRIHKIEWTSLEDYSSVPDLQLADTILGVVKIGDHLVQLLDFEKIIFEMNPENENITKANSEYIEKHKNKKIFIVEDSTTIRKFIKKTLMNFGFDVIDFENANYLIDYLKNGKHPDLIVSDLEMPQINGIQLISILKGDPATNKIPIIIFTSLDTEENKSKALKAGAIDFISKSNINNLVERIDKYIKGARA
jgi:two-component system chemotaxis response regulator CheV